VVRSSPLIRLLIRLRRALADAAGAWVFYSVLPGWPALTPGFRRIARFAPLVGAVIGGLEAGVWWLTASWLPPEARAALVLVLGLALSGGLHADGVMDTADGLAAGERALAAMEDSRVGAAGVQAFVQLLLLKFAGLVCLAVLPAAAAALAIVSTAWSARIAPLLAIREFTYLREGGTAGFHRRHRRGLGRELVPALLLAPLLLAGLPVTWPSPAAALWALGLSLLPVLLVPRWIGHRVGGHSGDSYGACVEWCEALGLLVMGLVARAAA
jgi:adenosylcobinamide-GDP ribazoletransferase